MKTTFTILLFISSILSGRTEEEAKLPEHCLPVLQNWLHQNSEVVEVCVFREEWKAPTEKSRKGFLLRYATITRIHKGAMKVGERVVLTSPVEIRASEWKREARRRPDRVSPVDGELMVVMFSRADCEKKGGYWGVGHDICRFSFEDDFYRAFQRERARDPKLLGIQN